ncbi:MAG: hypothetical protein N4A57_00010 [Anaeromicrobium sp.]|jgi:hypothetical protein|uniref:TRADD-N-associated membrane domain-containing protein n=1 Tax=Anaeromicrobium sp. TaxID=1929132 RepID=UPI0025EF4126|nr:hypothetical protein [Anaeromicrobium sp.]MCT4592648.1 hypothetical protein [Anaeromicrobium sp.]
MSWDNVVFTTVFLIVFAAITSFILFVQSKVSKKDWIKEDIETQDEISKINKEIVEEFEDNALKMMARNLAELREYYIISKQQARKTFFSASLFSSIGFVILLLGIVAIFIKEDKDVAKYTIISSMITDSIAGLFFWMYTKSLNQLNLYHDSLRQTEKYAIAINACEKVSVRNRDVILVDIIQKMIQSEKNLDISGGLDENN